MELNTVAILALNNAHATELSWLTPERLHTLLAQAFMARGDGTAFIMAFDETAAYDSPNYLWFQTRYPRFIYVDRIVVAPAARKQGHARRLYADLFTLAGERPVCCEVNFDPPNPVSDAFHARLGFHEVGRAAIHGGSKTVRYLARPPR